MSCKQKMLMVLAAALLLLPGCVSKSSFEMLSEEASQLQNELAELRGDNQELQDEYNRQSRELDDLKKEKSTLLKQVAELTANKQELEEILAAREDNLSRIINDQRQEMARKEVDFELKQVDLKQRLAVREEEIKKLQESIAVLNAELDRLHQEKEQETKELSSTYEALLGKMESEIAQGQVTISELKGKLTVNLVEAVLFDSGKAEIKSDGLQVLQKVVDILKEVHDRTIRIEGHTDNVPIGGALARKYPTNWELSAARAVNVARFLQERGIDPENLASVAYGEYHPVATNDTPEDRAKNRRIEIILVARD
jgi:chemotaxis protein MotB